MMTIDDRGGGGGVKNHQNNDHVIYDSSLRGKVKSEKGLK